MAQKQTDSVIAVDSVRKVYIITYSNADTYTFNRQSFAEAIIIAFHESTTTKVEQWACSMESHKEGGFHFHMCILLNKSQRWLKVKNAIKDRFGIVVNFSGHSGYHSAYEYVTKEDTEFVASEGHPANVTAPKTLKATKAACKKGAKRVKKNKKLGNVQVAELMLKKQMHTMLEVLAYANSRKIVGDLALYEFILNRGQKKVSELLKSVWDIQSAKDKLGRSSQTRIEILQAQLKEPCVCEGQWLSCALEILQNNEVERAVFSDAIVKLLVMGRGKGRNIYICGPANCGKPFILDPLRIIFKSFLSPATCSYAWLGVEDKEIIFLNDFRYSPVIIPWSDLLLLLEGHVVHFAAPKTSYSEDILFEKDTPIFATSKAPITFVKNGVLDDRETEMMNVRWRMFTFRYQIPVDKQKVVPLCGHCFASLLLS